MRAVATATKISAGTSVDDAAALKKLAKQAGEAAQLLKLLGHEKRLAGSLLSRRARRDDRRANWSASPSSANRRCRSILQNCAPTVWSNSGAPRRRCITASSIAGAAPPAVAEGNLLRRSEVRFLPWLSMWWNLARTAGRSSPTAGSMRRRSTATTRRSGRCCRNSSPANPATCWRPAAAPASMWCISPAIPPTSPGGRAISTRRI